MNIGIVTHAYYPFYGGVTEHVAGSARALEQLGHEVTIITATANGANGDAKVVRIGQQLVWPLHGASVNVTIGHQLRQRLRLLFDDLGLDIVHVHSPLTPMLPLAAVRAAVDIDVPVVGTFHAAATRNLGYQLFRPALQKDFDRLTRRVAVSEPARTFVHRYFKGPVSIVPNGVDLERFKPADGAERVDEPPTILFVGRLDPRKGVEYLMEALPRIRERVPRTRLVVVGDGPRQRALWSLAERLGVDVVFEGAVSPQRLTHFYQHADVVCSPATCNESFGIVVLEAMACGQPVVVSDISGYRQLVQDGVQGFLVPPRASAALADRLTTLLLDDQRRRRMGRAARERAECFGWPRVGRELDSTYAGITGHAAAREPRGISIPEAEVAMPSAR